MIKNYFKIAFRTLSRNKLFTTINVLGLSMGICAALVIFLIVQYDFTFDKQHKDKERIFKVVTQGGGKEYSYNNPGVVRPLQDAINQVKGIEIAAPIIITKKIKVSKARKSKIYLATYEENSKVVFADKNLFKIFEFNWLAGNKETALNEANQVVLSEERAKKYFPNSNPTEIVGQDFFYDDTIAATVSGVVSKLEGNSSMNFQEFVSMKTIEANTLLKQRNHWDNWDGTGSRVQLIVKSDKNTTNDAICKDIRALVLANKRIKLEEGEYLKFDLKTLDELHFDEEYYDGVSRVANKKTLYSLVVVAMLLLLLGCINFINLSTAQSNTRAKEIGVRKCIGAIKQQLVRQLLSETFLLTCLATVLALIITPLILSLFKGFIPEEVNFGMVFQLKIVLFIIALVISVALFAGIYPALVLSGFKPIRILKGDVNIGGTNKKRFMRTLTVFQFAIAQFFIIATLIVSKQIYYSVNIDLGFNKDAIVNVELPASISENKNGNVLLQKLKAMPGIDDACLGGTPPCYETGFSSITNYSPKNSAKKEIVTQFKIADTSYFKFYNLKLIAGRAPYPCDSIVEYVINKSCLNAMGLSNPKDAIGEILLGGFIGTTTRVVGVMEDFHANSTRQLIQPTLYTYSKDDIAMLHISLNKKTTSNWSETLSLIESEWKKLYPDTPFKYEFFDETVANMYKEEKNTAKLLSWASGIALFISGMGLFALVLFMVNQRRKEIGVRKVLGASVSQIVKMLSKELVVLVLIALVVAGPIAWYMLNKWLQDFAYRIEIPIWIFIVTGLGTVLVALFTTAYNSIKAAIANPVKSLRTE